MIMGSALTALRNHLLHRSFNIPRVSKERKKLWPCNLLICSFFQLGKKNKVLNPQILSSTTNNSHSTLQWTLVSIHSHTVPQGQLPSFRGLEDLPYKGRLRKLGLVCLKRAQGGLVTMHQCIQGGCQEDEESLLQGVRW